MTDVIEIIRGDICDTDCKIILHQVNCQNAMGSGVAKALYTRWPEVKQEYHRLAGTLEPRQLLGRIQPVLLREFGGQKIVINMFTQLNYGRECTVLYTNYKALAEALEKINKIYPGKTIAVPQGLACVRAGGDWLKVERMVIEKLKDMKVKFYMGGS